MSLLRGMVDMDPAVTNFFLRISERWTNVFPIVVDTETTGSDVSRELLEVAVVLPLTGESFIGTVSQYRHDRMGGEVTAMHLRSGLLQDIMNQPSDIAFGSPRELALQFLNFLSERCLMEQRVALWCGRNPVFDFDSIHAQFGDNEPAHMMRSLVHYRMFDMTTVDMYATGAQLPAHDAQRDVAHRAISDVLSELRRLSTLLCHQDMLRDPRKD